MTGLGVGRAEPSSQPAHRPPRTRSGIAVVLSVLLLAGLAAGGLLGVRALVSAVAPSSGDYPGPGTGSVVVQVRPGDTAGAIAATLVRAGVVKSEAAFRRAAAADERSRSLQPGSYRLRSHMRAREALLLMLDPNSLVQGRVTIPEGTTSRGVVELLARNARVSAPALLAVLARPVALDLPPYAGGKAEGFLFPATYQFPPGATAQRMLADMVRRFEVAAEELDLEAAAQAAGRTPYDVLITASIVEGEARLPADFPKVAAVVYNRLARGMRLQMDSTINYVLPERKGHLTSADIRLRSPYNTYRVAGLPPTPIGSPGELALRAALHPTPGGLLYFVTMDSAGHNAFTGSYAEFLRLKAAAAKNRG